MTQKDVEDLILTEVRRPQIADRLLLLGPFNKDALLAVAFGSLPSTSSTLVDLASCSFRMPVINQRGIP